MKRAFDILQLMNIFVSRGATCGVFNKQDCFTFALRTDNV